MSSKPKLLFVFDHPHEDLWMDGLWAALNLLEDDFEVMKWNLRTPMEHLPKFEDYDFILGWGGFNSPVDVLMTGLKQKKGLCIGGNAFPPKAADSYDVLFYETKWYRPQISFHKNIVHAFGVNTDIYNKNTYPTPIVWDYIGVGSFSSWKRWEKMLDKKGNRFVIGQYQNNNEAESKEIVNILVKGNVMVSNQIHPFDLANYYNWAQTLYIPADVYGGGERAVWEAKACGLHVEVEEDNPKLLELVNSDVKDHYWYASQLKQGIMEVLNG